MSRSDGTDRYTYPGSDVLINKPGITDPLALDAFAADATAIQMLDISLILKALNKSKSIQRWLPVLMAILHHCWFCSMKLRR